MGRSASWAMAMVKLCSFGERAVLRASRDHTKSTSALLFAGWTGTPAASPHPPTHLLLGDNHHLLLAVRALAVDGSAAGVAAAAVGDAGGGIGAGPLGLGLAVGALQ